MAASMNHTVLPPGPDDRELLTALKYVLAGQEDVTISTSEGSAPLPDSVRGLLVDAVTALDGGGGDGGAASDGVDDAGGRGTAGHYPADVGAVTGGREDSPPGRHRRVELADVLAYRQHERARRGQVFEEMAQEETPDPGDAADGFASTR